MPWTETSSRDQRIQFISEWQKSDASMAALCRAFGISRQTGYKWVGRYFEFAEEGVRAPTLFEEQVLQPGAITALAKALLVAKDLCDCADHRHRLMR